MKLSNFSILLLFVVIYSLPISSAYTGLCLPATTGISGGRPEKNGLCLWQDARSSWTIAIFMTVYLWCQYHHCVSFCRLLAPILAEFGWNGRWLVGADLSFSISWQDRLLDQISSLDYQLISLKLVLLTFFSISFWRNISNLYAKFVSKTYNAR